MFIHREIVLKQIAYIVMGISLLLAILPPTCFHFVGSYAAPTATYAYILTNSAVLPAGNDYWTYAMLAESEYPAPSTLLGVYVKVLGLPPSLGMFQPLVGLASIVYFVLALKVMSLGGIKHKQALILSAVYYLFIVTGRLNAHYVGRATVGVLILVYFILALLIYLNGRKREGMITLLLLTLVTCLTYYTSALAIFLVGVFSYILIKVSAQKGYGRIKPYSDLLLLSLVVIALTIIRSLSISILLRRADLIAFYNNLVEYIKAQLKLDKTSEAYLLLVGLSEETNLLLRATQVWLRTLVNVISAATLSFLFLREALNLVIVGRKTSNLGIYTVTSFLCCCAELAYTFIAPTLSLRFFTIFGLPALIYVISFVVGSTNSKRSSSNHKLLALKVISLGLLLLISISSVAILQRGEMGAAKLYGFNRVKGLLAYLTLENPSSGIIIATDAGYSAIMYYQLRIVNVNVVVEPLCAKSVIIYYACNNASLYYDLLLHQLGPRWVLLLTNETLLGDEWGYAVKIFRCELVHLFSLVYYDSRFALIVTK